MTKLEKYAELLVKVGLNIQKGQILVISSPVETAEFTRVVSKKAYETEASDVVIRWVDEKSSRIRFDMASDEVFDEFPAWQKMFFEDYASKDAAFLSISASDPELMKGVDINRMKRATKANSIALEGYRAQLMSNKNVWCVASIPTVGWAKKVFPEVPEEKAVELLWEAIFKAVRANKEEPVEAWRVHQENLKEKVDYLNKVQFESFHYKNSLGTDITVGLPENHLWFGGGDNCEKGYGFIANMPTEEVFTMPHKNKVNGKVVSSIPLNYQGNLIEGLWLEFKDGVVVNYGAEKGKDALKSLLDTDEGAKRLGELALVPYDSPISNQNILFYNTLYDENASCHFALGKAYPICIENGSDMTKEELLKKGANDSLIHVDFMIGTKDLEIVGTTKEGKEIEIFKKGNFV